MTKQSANGCINTPLPVKLAEEECTNLSAKFYKAEFIVQPLLELALQAHNLCKQCSGRSVFPRPGLSHVSAMNAAVGPFWANHKKISFIAPCSETLEPHHGILSFSTSNEIKFITSSQISAHEGLRALRSEEMWCFSDIFNSFYGKQLNFFQLSSIRSYILENTDLPKGIAVVLLLFIISLIREYVLGSHFEISRRYLDFVQLFSRLSPSFKLHP